MHNLYRTLTITVAIILLAFSILLISFGVVRILDLDFGNLRFIHVQYLVHIALGAYTINFAVNLIKPPKDKDEVPEQSEDLLDSDL